jgi:FtsP/CotA-like multicopper oxidase with cupredoxin domain
MNDRPNITRRRFLTGTAAAAGGVTLLQKLSAAEAEQALQPEKPRETSALANRNKPLLDRVDPKPTESPGEPGRDYTPVITPNNVSLPWKIVGGVKVYHLVAEEVDHEFAPGMRAKCWGFNGHVHGPTIEAVEGDRVRIYVTNNLPEATSVHWHGILLPNGMDGVGGLTQKNIQPGETFRYEFTLRQHGTQMYHSHSDEMTQMALGTMGLFIIHPRRPKTERPDRDFAFMLSEWRLDTGTSRPNPNEMTDFNVFTFNAKIFPATEPMVTKLGDRVRIRIASVAVMEHHPIHLHGYHFRITETDGGQIPESAQQVETTVLVGVGQSRTFDFVADAPGDWPMHCHMTHHVMTQMGDKFPNTIGVQPGKLDEKIRASLLPGYMTMGTNGMGEMAEMHMKMPRNSLPMVGAPGPFDVIDMSGLLTLLKVREGITSYDDPGWYQHPQGTVATVASGDQLSRDGIEVNVSPTKERPPEHQHSG